MLCQLVLLFLLLFLLLPFSTFATHQYLHEKLPSCLFYRSQGWAKGWNTASNALNREGGKGVSYYDASIAWFFLRQMFFSFSFCFVCFCASSWQAVNTCAIRWISNGIPMSCPLPSPLPVSHSQVRTMYFAFTVQRSRRHVPSLSAVVVVFVFVFVAARNGQCTHTIPAAAAAAGARECEWVRAPYCVCVCVCLSVCCLSTGNPYAAMLGVSLLLWLHSPSSERQYSSQERERPSQRERANDGKCLWESASISSSVDDAVCLRRPPVWATLC